MFVEGEFVQTAHLNSSEHNRGVSFHFSRVCLSRSCVLSQIPPQHSEATRYNVLMLAEVTLLAVLLFIAWPDKWIEVCACDRISSDVSFSHCRLAHAHNLQKGPFENLPSVQVRLLMDEPLSVVASWFMLSPLLCCVQSCDSEKILSAVSLWHIIIADHLALISHSVLWYLGDFHLLAFQTGHSTKRKQGLAPCWCNSITTSSWFPFGYLAQEEFDVLWVSGTRL